MNIWQTFLFQPLLNALIAFYHLFGNLGAAIMGMTVSLRIILLPLTLPALKTAEKMKEIAPELEKLKEEHEDDKQALAQAQMELYKEEGVKPFAGILPQILQIVILIALFQAFRNVLGNNGGVSELNKLLYPFLKLPEQASLNLRFWYLNLSKPDLITLFGRKVPGLFLVGAAVTQFLSAKLRMPQAKEQEKVAKETEDKGDDFASMMQTQSMYLFPIMTLLIGTRFPSGLVLYWFVFSLFNLVQQLILNKNNG